MERETKDFITLALLFYFMSFTAFALRKHCGSEWTSDELNDGWIAMQMEVNLIHAQRYFEGDGLRHSVASSPTACNSHIAYLVVLIVISNLVSV